MQQDFQTVCGKFMIPGTFSSCHEIKNGNVNHTYRVTYLSEDGTTRDYILQSVNTYAFAHPVEIMNNIDLVTRHIQQKKQGRASLQFCHTEDGKSYLYDDSGFWRMYSFIEADMYNSCEDPLIVRSAGEAFGEFQRLLSDVDMAQVFDTTPWFHDTRKRLEKLFADAEEDPCGRVAEVQSELAYLTEMQDKACAITDAFRRGELPLRVTHNDTKINNVLFKKGTHEAMAVIDLDTIMPGLSAHDFGDAIRSAANTVAEDCKDLGQVAVNMDVFTAFADGFLSQTAPILTQREIDLLPISSFSIACELGGRFLDDYICGDLYFNTSYPGHNLDRARCQLALAKVLWEKQEEMEAIIRRFAEKYR